MVPSGHPLRGCLGVFSPSFPRRGLSPLNSIGDWPTQRLPRGSVSPADRTVDLRLRSPLPFLFIIYVK